MDRRNFLELGAKALPVAACAALARPTEAASDGWFVRSWNRHYDDGLIAKISREPLKADPQGHGFWWDAYDPEDLERSAYGEAPTLGAAMRAADNAHARLAKRAV